MLDVRVPEGKQSKLPAVRSDTVERVEFQRLGAAPAVQLIARDAFVSDMAIKLDQLHIEIGGLARELGSVKAKMAELRDDSDRNYRFSAFQETGQRANAAKLDEALRRCKDLRERVEKIDGKSGGNYHGYNSLESVSIRLTELGALERQFRDVDRKLKLSAGIFCASVVLWLLAVLA